MPPAVCGHPIEDSQTIPKRANKMPLFFIGAFYIMGTGLTRTALAYLLARNIRTPDPEPTI